MPTDTPAKARIQLLWNPRSETEGLPTYELSLTAVEGLKSGTRITLDLYGTEAKEKLGLFESLQIELAKKGNVWSFRNLRDLRPAGDAARKGTHLYCDRFRLIFTGITGTLECILPADQNGFGGLVDVEIRGSIDSDMLPVQAAKQRIPRKNPAHLVIGMQTLSEQMDAFMHPAPAEFDQIPDYLKLRKDASMAILARQAEAWNQSVKAYFQSPDTTYKVHISKFHRFNELSRKILRIKGDLWKAPYALDRSPFLAELHAAQKEQRQIQDEMNQYLDLDRGIPDSYRTAARKGATRRKEIQNIDMLMKDPFVQLLCCLPMGGLIEGGLLIAKGEVAKGMLIAGLNVVTYGGFKNIKNAVATYRKFQSATEAEKSILRPLVESRLSAFFTSRTEWTLASWRIAGKTVEQVNAQLGGFVSIIPYVMDFSRFKIDDFCLLFRNKELLTNCLKVAKDQDYRRWLQQTKDAESTLLALATLRSLAVLKLGYPEYEKMIGQNTPESSRSVQKAMLGGVEMMRKMLRNNPAEEAWLRKDVTDALNGLPVERFSDGKLGLFQDWRFQEDACVAELNRLKLIPRRPAVERRSTLAEMSQQLADLKQKWDARAALIQSQCGTLPDSQIDKCVKRVVASANSDPEFDTQMEKFVNQLLGVQSAASLTERPRVTEINGVAVQDPPSSFLDLDLIWSLNAPFRVLGMNWIHFQSQVESILTNHFQE